MGPPFKKYHWGYDVASLVSHAHARDFVSLARKRCQGEIAPTSKNNEKITRMVVIGRKMMRMVHIGEITSTAAKVSCQPVCKPG